MEKTVEKIARIACQIGNTTPHDVLVQYFTKTRSVTVAIYYGGFDANPTPKILNSLYKNIDTIYFELLDMIVETENCIAI